MRIIRNYIIMTRYPSNRVLRKQLPRWKSIPRVEYHMQGNKPSRVSKAVKYSIFLSDQDELVKAEQFNAFNWVDFYQIKLCSSRFRPAAWMVGQIPTLLRNADGCRHGGRVHGRKSVSRALSSRTLVGQSPIIACRLKARLQARTVFEGGWSSRRTL